LKIEEVIDNTSFREVIGNNSIYIDGDGRINVDASLTLLFL